VLVISLIFLFIFSSLIAAYRYANKVLLTLENKKNEENKTSYTVSLITEKPRLYVASLKFGSVICWVLIIYYGTQLFWTFKHEVENEIAFFLIYFSVTLFVLYLFEHFLSKVLVKPNATFIITKLDKII